MLLKMSFVRRTPCGIETRRWRQFRVRSRVADVVGWRRALWSGEGAPYARVLRNIAQVFPFHLHRHTHADVQMKKLVKIEIKHDATPQINGARLALAGGALDDEAAL